jgi:hypothetical protein
MKRKRRQSAHRRQNAPRPALPSGLPTVGRPGTRAALVDAELKRHATRIERDFLTVCELVQEVITEGYYARYGFVDAERYLEDRLGLSYRSVRKRVAALEAIRSLPATERESARQAIAEVGATKASILAPALKQDADGWRDWVKHAATETVEDLQSRVTTALGLKARGPAPEAPGAKFLAYVLNQVGDAREEVMEAFELGMRLARSDHAVAVFIALCREVLPDWRARANAGVE